MTETALRAPTPARQVTVIGAGLVGLATALYLQRNGHAVSVIDRQPPGSGASFGNAGILATGNCAPVGMPSTIRRVPRMLLDPIGPLAIRWRYLPEILPWLLRMAMASRPRRVEQISAALGALLQRAELDYRPLWSQSDALALIRPRGWLKVYASHAAFAAMAAEHDLMARRGVRLEILKPDAIRQLEPALAPIFRCGTFQPDCAFVLDPKRLVDHFADDFHRRGGVIHQADVKHIAATERGWRLALDQSEMQTDIVVLAAGAWSRALAAQLGVKIPLDTERGYHLMLPSQPGQLGRPVSFGDHSFTLVPMAHGIRLSTGIEFAGLDAAPDFRRIRGLLPHAARMLPGLAGEPQSEWLGFRPSLPDSLPVLGSVPGRRGAYLAFGHHHLGLTLAGVTGRIVADLVAQRDPGIDLAPYSPRRWA